MSDAGRDGHGEGGSTPKGDDQVDEGLWAKTVDVILTGFAVILPVVITLYLIDLALEMLAKALRPVISVLNLLGVISWVETNVVYTFLFEIGVASDIIVFLSELVAAVLLIFLVVVVGVVARNQYGDRIIDYFDIVIGAIPGIGAIYGSFRRMGDAMIESDIENFRSVKLIEFPTDGSYVIGFETAESPASVRAAAGADDMVTLFVPFAPNPVMGGFLGHFPKDRVHDLDMPVEQGVQSIITSGIATGDAGDRPDEVSLDMNADQFPNLSDALDPDKNVTSGETEVDQAEDGADGVNGGSEGDGTAEPEVPAEENDPERRTD